MEDGYCCSCAEIIWNPLPFEKILSQMREYVKNNYPGVVLHEWERDIIDLVLRKEDSFGSISFCPNCVVFQSKRILEEITQGRDSVLEKCLLTFEEL